MLSPVILRTGQIHLAVEHALREGAVLINTAPFGFILYLEVIQGDRYDE